MTLPDYVVLKVSQVSKALKGSPDRPGPPAQLVLQDLKARMVFKARRGRMELQALKGSKDRLVPQAPQVTRDRSVPKVPLALQVFKASRVLRETRALKVSRAFEVLKVTQDRLVTPDRLVNKVL